MEVSPPLQIQCFGGFHVNLSDEPITAFNTDKVRALFIYLLVEKGQFFQRSHLAGLLWSDIPEEQALHNLRQAISLLRKATREVDQSIIYADREMVGLQPKANVKVDVLEFTHLIKAAYRYHKNHNGLGTIDIIALRKAIDLYQNPFLDRYRLNVSPLFEEWLLITREKFDTAAMEGLAYLAGYYERRDERTNAIHMLRKIIHIMPWDEKAHYQLIQLLAQDGQWSAAQKQYASLVYYLKNDLNVSPDPQTVVLFDQVRAQSLSSIHSKGGTKTLHNLPLMTSNFVGRQKEIANLSELVANPIIRLVNILGLGGIGKTRLALEITFFQYGVFGHGVFMVPLRNAHSFDEFLTAIGQILQIHFTDQYTKEQQVLGYCRQKQLLLLLDNLDELSTNQQVQLFLEAMVKDCQHVMILVTSRQKVKINEETIFALDGLDFQESRESVDKAEELPDAVLLFEQKVQNTQRKFKISLENKALIIKLCRLVEGHPLAIELVAGSISGNVEQRIEETIEQGMSAYVSALANSQQHHQTLAAVFEVSWNRLTLQEKSDLAKLSVLKGGFTDDTVYKIYKIDAHSLSQLIDKSLLRIKVASRYDMHEIVRQFAELKCKQMGSWESAVQIVTDYYLNFLQEQAIFFESGEQSSCLDWIERELNNIKVGWDWVLQTKQFSLLLEIVDVLYQYFNIRSRFTQGIDWLLVLKTQIEAEPEHQLLYAKVLNRIGSLAYRARKNELAKISLEKCYELLNQLDNDREMALCLVSLGAIELRYKKNYQKALENATQSMELYQNLQDPSGEAYAAYFKGIILNRMSDYDLAELTLQHSITLARETRNERRMVAPLNVMGDIACIKGQYDKAKLFFEEALEIATHLGDRFNQGILLNNLATLFHYSKEYEKEKEVLLESLAICEEIGDQDGIALAYNNLCEVNIVKGEFEQAIINAEKGLAIGRQIGEEWTIIVSLNNLGEACTKLNQLDKAMELFSQAICKAQEIGSLDLVARIAVNIGMLMFWQGKKQGGQNWLIAAISHSAIEFDHKQKAIHLLAENLIEYDLVQNDDGLESIIAEFCSKK
jgi:DNA-binding SARP family transcriptional activator